MRIYNAGYTKLFMSICGYELNESHIQIDKLKQQYYSFDKVVVPIISNFTKEKKYKLKEIRDNAIMNGCNTLLFEIEEYLDPNISVSHDYAYDSLHNTNYSFITNDHEIAYSALLTLLGLEIDGKDKIIVYEVAKPNEFCVFDLVDFNFDKITDTSFLQLNEPIEQSFLQYLSLFWIYSQSEVYEKVRNITSKIRYETFNDFKSKGLIAELNILKSIRVKSPPPKVFFNLSKSDDYKTIYNYLDSHDPSYIKKIHPRYSLEYILSIEAYKNNSALNSIVSQSIHFKSRVFLKSALIVKKMTSEENFDDYSSVIIGYTKFFENEINVTLVQKIREHLGIDMPDYYLRHYPRHGYFIVRGEKNLNVDFNRGNRRTGKYIPPGLGQSLLSFKTIMYDLNLDINEEQFVELGLQLNNIRNRVAHPEITSKEDLRVTERLLRKLDTINIFEELIEIKQEIEP